LTQLCFLSGKVDSLITAFIPVLFVITCHLHSVWLLDDGPQ
jgi:hypothetical protein